MKKVQLRRSLYIGLGGTGMNAILHTKKMYMETYGEIPPMVSFLGIDTDGKGFTTKLESKVGTVYLERNEQKPITVERPKDYYLANRDLCNWMPKENERAITTLDRGAGQIRTNGRLAVVYNAPSLENSLKAAIDKVRSQEVITSDKYELDVDANKDDVHMVFSLGGGTGCGTFIDTAYLLKDIADSDTLNIVGYAVLPDVFSSMIRNGTAMARVKPNAFGAIRDLDYLMHLDPSSPTLELKYPGRVVHTNEAPFSAVNFIDNKNGANITYDHINQLAEVIALSLFTSSGKIADKISSVNDNVAKTISEGSLDVGNKRAWVSSIGACEIVFKGQELANVYAKKAAVRIINRLLNDEADANSIANNWIDSPNVNIRENNGRDNLIDQFCDKQPKFEMGEVGIEQTDAEIKAYYDTAVPADKDLNGILHSIVTKLNSEIHNLILGQINKEDGCVTTSLAVLDDIVRQIDIFMSEITEEMESLKKELTILNNEVKVGIEDLQHWVQKAFVIPGRRARIGKAKDDIAVAVMGVATLQIEMKRRDYANNVYRSLKITIEEERAKVNVIRETLKNVLSELSREIVNIQNDVEKQSAVFQINLAKDVDVTVDNDTIILNEFFASLPRKNLYYIGDSNATKEALLNHTENLPGAEAWKNKSIDSAIDEMADEDFNEKIRIATEKAKPLMKFNGRGNTVGNGEPLEQAINRYYYVGLPDADSSRFTKDDAFGKLQQSDIDINFLSTGSQDRIILYRQDGVVPAFAVHPLESFKYDYENTTTFSGFDFNLHEKMIDEDFSLIPKAKKDEDIEFWVKGFIFGFIKYEDKKYWYKDWKNGRPLKDYWLSTFEGSRDKAYERFKRNISNIRKQYTEKIEEEININGTAATNELIKKVRNSYFDLYANCEVNRETIQKKGYEKIADLMNEELQYVEDKLSSSL